MMKMLSLCLLLIPVITFAQSNYQKSTDQLKPLKIADEVVFNLSSLHPYNTTQQEGVVFEKTFKRSGSSYIKIYFKNFDLAPGDYVEISGQQSGEKHIYARQGKIIDENLNMISDFWSQILFDEQVTVRLHVKAPSNAYGFDIERVAFGYPEEEIEQLVQMMSICGNDDKEQIICYNGTTMYDKGRAVCRLVIGGGGLCTGWLLGCDGHVMTNNHCIGSVNDANNTDFVFNYENSNCAGTTTAAAQTVAASSTLIKTNASLDYTLVQLPVNPTSTYGYLSLSSASPQVGDRIYIPQHPGGRRKEIAVVTDVGGNAGGFAQVNSINGTGCRYYADTEGGSSGSPVIDFNTNLVIAIHNTGGCTNGSYGRSDQLVLDIGTDMPNCGLDSSGLVVTPCTNVIGSFPYTESFENTFGLWVNETTDNMDWTNTTGATPSNGTGPSAASDGTYYAYMEASNPNYPSRSAILTGPCFDLTSLTYPELIFDYHMYGASMGSLVLQVSTDGLSWTSLWSLSGDQGNSWYTDTVNLAAYANSSELRVRFYGTTGTNFDSDIAIDAVTVQQGTFTCNSTVTSFPYTESFENTFGDWEQDVNDNFDWAINTGGTPSTNTGPTAAIDGNYYAFIEASSPNFPNLVANLISPCFDLTQTSFPELVFKYHMFGANMGTLNLEVSVGGGPWTTIWARGGDLGDYWNTGLVDLSDYRNESSVRLRFNAITGGGFESDFAIDGIGIRSSQVNCVNTINTFPYVESFENTLGLWTQELDDDFDWTIQTGATPSNGTGPTSANDGNYYIFIEASTPNYPIRSSILNSPCIDISNVANPTLTFDYHMFGTDVGWLDIQARTGSTGWTTLWTLNGSQGDFWISDTISLTPYINASDLVFRIRGISYGWSSDIAIDAFSVFSDVCSAVSSVDLQTSCGPFTWIDGITYTSNNTTATDTLFGASSSGCDSVVTLNLTIASPTSGTDVQTSCGPLTWIDGNTYNSNNNTATYTIVNGSSTGCDSVVTLNLTISSPTSANDNQTACGTFTWIDGNTYTSSNTTATYTYSGGAFNGCDSIVTLNLTINNPGLSTDTRSACNSFTWIDGNTYTSSNTTATYTFNGGAFNGCDSIVTLNLTINNPSTSTDTHSACNSYTWIDGNTYTSSNNIATYTYSGGAFNGCDSIVTLNLVIYTTSNGTDVQTACSPLTWIDGNTYNSNNNTATYTYSGGAYTGCDSIVTLNLTIITIDTSVTQNGFDLTANQQGASYQWIDCNNGFSPISGETGQTYSPLASGNFAVIITIGSCSEISSCIPVIGLNQSNIKSDRTLKIMPNPSSGLFTIESLGEKLLGIRVFDMSGKLIFDQRLISSYQYQLQLDEIAAGVYTLEIMQGNVPSYHKLVKY